MNKTQCKTVAVLLATYNGLQWLPAQVDSILNQGDVNILLFISDDMSTDGTWAWLQDLAIKNSRVILLPRKDKLGRAGLNFFRLLLDADLSDADFIAYSDQDDIWELDKLSRHVNLAIAGGYDGVSSNVTAFWPDTSKAKIIKSQPQRSLDYLFESAGPGCTFLMTPWLAKELVRLLNDFSLQAKDIALHDWFTYAVCRASGRQWFIDSASTVRYRQHSANELGANKGLQAIVSRLRKISNGWYRSEVLKILNVCIAISNQTHFFLLRRALTDTRRIRSRVALLSYIPMARRKFFDRITLALAIVLGVF
ncbi:MAG: UDP-Glc:alpha-D-GlcNAc-diphosphoundecaprenol beta-1,3-glucosyltransferase WfgD [Syntrophomonadaceae bacterium]|nr:UDP-Glc:alpha-D-GlcNAc-diphosphoundecaprenol beta-1,3-glucosyltransferase WfgD [Bacillota bacterium]